MICDCCMGVNKKKTKYDYPEVYSKLYFLLFLLSVLGSVSGKV